ncbi:MAG: manganese-dependent inorganic pyrophosphatase [Clostridiales bacterium]|jgi:manganese-dependent inorganic pyrophosphatase|nr:manganese-dependent inorganic pyrophosphatase [Clostridiales bacterium]MDN5299478.1 manganese-dependent inorganic pyrophosphatase [Clostridiales bacterium]
MNEKVMIFGHRNPDTDSVTSAIALAYLKSAQGMDATPYVLGEISKETAFVLNRFNVTAPDYLDNVKIQLKDLNLDRVDPLTPDESILTAYNHMNSHRIRTLPVVDDSHKLLGIMTMKDIAMNTINGDFYKLDTSFENVQRNLNGTVLNYGHPQINGHILITAFHDTTIIREDIFDKHSVIITGDRYDVIDYAIASKAQLIIITGDMKVPDKLVEKAAVTGVNMISTPFDTYYTSRIISQTNTLGSIMEHQKLIRFKEDEYLENVKELIQTSKHSKFPVVDSDGKYVGIISRRHLLNPGKKNVIVVDHNEHGQSAEGLHEANVIEVIDHHKIGDISTHLPIAFRNLPVGSTNTIIYQMFLEQQTAIPESIAGLMLSGIISDTLLLKSPTTTPLDETAVADLSKIVDVNPQQFAMEMFKTGTSVKGKTTKEVFFNDFKEFVQDGYKLGVSQVFTLDVEEIFEQKDAYLALISETHHHRDHYATLMVITDIINEGSYMLYESKHENLMALTFSKPVEQGTYIEDCVSRKKQIIPKLIDAIQMIK